MRNDHEAVPFGVAAGSLWSCLRFGGFALTRNNVAGGATLDLANAANRASAFAVIDSALGNLETALGMKFNATTLSQL
jgi:hypothetical protein